MKNKNQKENKENNDETHKDLSNNKNKINESFDINVIEEKNLNKSFINRKRLLDESPKNEAKDKKLKSDGDSKIKKDFNFIFKKITNFKFVYDNWNQHIKSIKINEDKILNKLLPNELILKNCREIAIQKIKNLKDDDIDEIYNILSYDNTNPNILYLCFKRINQNLNEWLNKYRYCLSNEMDIIDYYNDNNIFQVDLKKEFKYNFIFNNIAEAKNKLKDTVEHLIALAFNYDCNINILPIIDDDDDEEDEIENKHNIFIYEYNSTNNTIIYDEKEKENKLYQLGYNFIRNYTLIKDFNKFKQNQPFAYENNEVLYFSFLLYELYKPLLKINEKKIIIKNKLLILIQNLIPLLTSIKNDLTNNIINKEFILKIRFFNIIFESSNLEDLQNVNDDFTAHLLKNKLTSEKINEFINIRKTIDKFNYKKIKYEFKDNNLIIENSNNIIKYNINDYDEALINGDDYIFLKAIWEKNSLSSFQNYNFLSEDDIELIKETIKKIFYSKFWLEVLNLFCDNDIVNLEYFQTEEFIQEFLNKIIFLPFKINNLALFAFTTSDDLLIFISGYPFKNIDYNFQKYNLYRILQSGMTIIIILHEAIHYIKRVLYFITCGIIERNTIYNNKREDAGDIFEILLFNWKTKDEQKINIEIALKLLNINIYQNGFDGVKKIIFDGKDYEKDTLLKRYLEKFGLNDLQKYNKFIDKNKNIYLNASKQYLSEKYVIHYFRQDHSKLNI